MKRKKVLMLLAVVVGLPTLVSAFYFFIIASKEYVSEARFTIKGANSGSQQHELLGFILGGVGGNNFTDPLIVQDYILSMDMLDVLESRINLSGLYGDRSIDFFSRLSSSASREEFLEYFRKRVGVSFDNTSGIVTLRVRAYRQAEAKAIADAILAASEALVNRISERAQADAVALAKSEAAKAEQNVIQASSAVKAFRNERGDINPPATAQAILTLVGGLEAELAKTSAELAEAMTYMRENSPRIVALKTKIAALRFQVGSEKSRLTGKDEETVSELVDTYQKLNTQLEFAEKQYTAALAALEVARVQAIAKGRYLEPIVRPSLPDRHDVYRGIRGVAAVSGICLLAFIIASLGIAAIKEHSGL